MARVDWVVVCDRAGFNQAGIFNIYGVWRRIAVDRMPASFDKVVLAVCFTAAPTETIDVVVDMTGPTGETLRCGEHRIGRRTADVGAIEVSSVVFSQEGEYVFDVQVDESRARVWLEIRFITDPPSTAVH